MSCAVLSVLTPHEEEYQPTTEREREVHRATVSRCVGWLRDRAEQERIRFPGAYGEVRAVQLEVAAEEIASLEGLLPVRGAAVNAPRVDRLRTDAQLRTTVVLMRKREYDSAVRAFELQPEPAQETRLLDAALKYIHALERERDAR